MENEDFTANLEYYRAFYYAAKHGNITEAAERLYLSQPTVTKAIQRLEEQLGCPLFSRSRRGVRLTPEGRIVWNRVEPAMRLIMAGEQELRESRRLEGGALSVVSTEMSCRTYIIPALERFARDYPNVKIRFRNALTENVLDMVRSGNIDMAILHVPFRAGDDLELSYIDSIEECFVAGERFRALSGGEHSLAELAAYPLISTPEGSSAKQYLVSLFESQGLVFNPDIEVTTIDLVAQAISHGLGIGTLPTLELERRASAERLYRVPINLPPLERKAYAITSREIPPGPAAKVFLGEYLAPKGEKA